MTEKEKIHSESQCSPVESHNLINPIDIKQENQLLDEEVGFQAVASWRIKPVYFLGCSEVHCFSMEPHFAEVCLKEEPPDDETEPFDKPPDQEIEEPHFLEASLKEEVVSDDGTETSEGLLDLQDSLIVKEDANNGENVPRVSSSEDCQSLKTEGSTSGASRRSKHLCEKCGRSFRSVWELRHHAVIHVGEETHFCKYCEKTFSKTEDLKRHEQTHFNLYSQHRCRECGRGFRERSGLLRHEAVHSGEKSERCPICGKTFAQKSHVARHLHTHTKTKQHGCPHCSKKFGDPSALATHLRRHTGERPYTCDLCGMAFVQKCHLIRHIPRKHGPKNEGKRKWGRGTSGGNSQETRP